MYILSYVSIITVIIVEFMSIEEWTNFQIHLNNAPFVFVFVFLCFLCDGNAMLFHACLMALGF